MKRSDIGGQAVIEGVMMRSPEKIALAVRKPDGSISLTQPSISTVTQRHPILKKPFLRGVVMLCSSMAVGMKMITESAKIAGMEDMQAPSKLENAIAKKTNQSSENVMMFFAILLAVGLAVGLFFLLPSFLIGFLRPFIASSLVLNLIEGVLRILLFIGYVAFCSLIKDVRRTFQYHGAEHKTINCYEHEQPLDVEHVQKFTTKHPRCGTNYMLLVMVISVLVVSLTGFSGHFAIRALIRILLLPVVASLAYEVLRLAAKSDNWLCRILRAPGILLQRLTTHEPDDGMVEVALAAFKLALGYEREDIEEYVNALPRTQKQDTQPEGVQPEEGAGEAIKAADPLCALQETLPSQDLSV
ncbi:MAG: DUF1385 domain-containing protein [Christensenellales bacterium]